MRVCCGCRVEAANWLRLCSVSCFNIQPNAGMSEVMWPRFGGHLYAWGESPEALRRSVHGKTSVGVPAGVSGRSHPVGTHEGKPKTQIARERGITLETLRLWLKQANLDAGPGRDGLTSDGLTSDEQEALRRLRRENRIFLEEREILKEAAAFFAQEAGSRR